MKIEILKDERYALGGIDVRDFVKGEQVDIKDAHAYRMIELGIAEDCAKKIVKSAPVEVEPVETEIAEPKKKGKAKKGE